MTLLDVGLAVLPIVVLLVLLLKKHPLSSSLALFVATLFLYGVRRWFFDHDPTFLHAGVIEGILTAWTPIMIVWGAIIFFRTMEISGAMFTIRRWLTQITHNPIAQFMIIGWAFAYLIEGVSGFGTPAALAAPLLVGLGFKPLRTIVVILAMNGIFASFGALGLPTWFGIGEIGLGDDMLRQIGILTAFFHLVGSLFVPYLGLHFLFPHKKIRANLKFIFLSSLSCTLPALLTSLWSIEFPTVLGGAAGLALTIWMTRREIGLETHAPYESEQSIPTQKLFKAFLPLGLVIVLLLITRLEFIGLKQFLTNPEPFFVAGRFGISSSLVLTWKNILGTSISWTHPLLYIPSILPFLLVAEIMFWIFKVKKAHRQTVFRQSSQQIIQPIFALTAAVVLARLFMIGGETSPAQILGGFLANIAGQTWVFFAPFLGTLGAFFSGSNTVSNLMFAPMQFAAANDLNLPSQLILALQNVGGSIGNMLSLSNIIAACAVLGINGKEGKILSYNFLLAICYILVAGILGVLFFVI